MVAKFTAKHYEQISGIVRRIKTYNPEAARICYLETAELFARDNREFSRDRYRTACDQDDSYGN